MFVMCFTSAASLLLHGMHRSAQNLDLFSRPTSIGAVQAATTDAEDDLAGADVYGFLAKQMHKEAGKNQDSLKQDVLKVSDTWPA